MKVILYYCINFDVYLVVYFFVVYNIIERQLQNVLVLFADMTLQQDREHRRTAADLA